MSDGHGRSPDRRLLALERWKRLVADQPDLEKRVERFLRDLDHVRGELAEAGITVDLALSPQLAEAQKVHRNEPFWERAATEPVPRIRQAR